MPDEHLDANHIRRRIAENLESPSSLRSDAARSTNTVPAVPATPPANQPNWNRPTRRDKMKNAINRIPVVGTLIRYFVKFIMIPPRYYQTQRKVSVLKGQMNEVMRILALHSQSRQLNDPSPHVNTLDNRLSALEVETRERLLDLKTDLVNHISSTLSQAMAFQSEANTTRHHIEQIAADLSRIAERQDFHAEALKVFREAFPPAELPVHVGPEPAAAVGLDDLTERYAALADFVRGLDITDPQVEADAFYNSLELVLRGSEEVITDRQRHYIESLSASMPDRSRPILDLGCGRGEFLGVLRDSGLKGVGVDINTRFVEHVHEQGLEAHVGDALSYLSDLEDNSLGGITAFQVIEHVGFDYLQDLLKVARTKLAPGGFILLETVNPYCLDTFKMFYLDPTHVRPVPKDLLTIAMIFYGFENPQVYWQSPIPAKGEIAPALNALYYQNHAVVAYRPA